MIERRRTNIGTTVKKGMLYTVSLVIQQVTMVKYRGENNLFQWNCCNQWIHLQGLSKSAQYFYLNFGEPLTWICAIDQ